MKFIVGKNGVIISHFFWFITYLCLYILATDVPVDHVLIFEINYAVFLMFLVTDKILDNEWRLVYFCCIICLAWKSFSFRAPSKYAFNFWLRIPDLKLLLFKRDDFSVMQLIWK